MSFEHRKIGEILVEMGALAPAEVRLVLDQQDHLNQRFGEIAIDKGLIKGVVNKFQPAGVNVRLQHDNQACRNKGGEYCTILVSW